MSYQIEVREGAKRQHLSLAMFCVLYAWEHNRQAILISEEMLKSYLGLQRLKTTRIDWLLADVRNYFEYSYQTDKGFFVFSKVPKEELEKNSKEELEKNSKIYKKLEPSSLGLQEIYKAYELFNIIGIDAIEEKVFSKINNIFPYLNGLRNKNEFVILNSLSLLSNGICLPKDIFKDK